MEGTANDRIVGEQDFLDMLLAISAQVGVDVSLALCKSILRRAAAWLSSSLVRDVVESLGSRVSLRMLSASLNAMMRFICENMLRRIVTGLAEIACSAVTVVGDMIGALGVLGMILDFIDPAGYNQAMDRRLANELIHVWRYSLLTATLRFGLENENENAATAKKLFDPGELQRKSASDWESNRATWGLAFPGKFLPDMYEPLIDFAQLEADKRASKEFALRLMVRTREYIAALEVNSLGEKLDWGGTNDERIEVPASATDWHAMLRKSLHMASSSSSRSEVLAALPQPESPLLASVAQRLFG
jgi:hypothetical protein